METIMTTKEKLAQVTYRMSQAGIHLDNDKIGLAIDEIREAINYAESVISDLTHGERGDDHEPTSREAAAI